jgi:hypothetical protein
VRSHAKASSAGSTERQAALAGLALLVALMLLAGVAGEARAGQVHPFKEVFGGASQPSFSNPEGLAVDQSTGDLLVIDAGESTVSRWNPDGTAANFSALGTNVIDAKEGGGGKPCGEEPESCDQTPENGLSFGTASEVQVTVDNSGGPTDGDIYVSQSFTRLVDIFGADGSYLGQLTAAGGEAFEESCGVGVDGTGAVYVGDYTKRAVHKFVPAANPPVNADNTANFSLPQGPCSVSAGTGPSAGSIFVAAYEGPVFKLDSTTGALAYEVSTGENVTEAVDPNSGNVLVATQASVLEYDASGPSQAVQASRLAADSAVHGVAVDGSGQVYVSRAGEAGIEVFGPAVPAPTPTIAAATNVTGTRATLNGSVNPEGVEVTECFFEYGETTSYGNTAPCKETIPTDSEAHAVSANISGLAANGTTYHYRLVAGNANGAEKTTDKTLVTGNTVITEAATNVGATAATVSGILRPEGAEFSACRFEYKLTTETSFEEAPCVPGPSEIEVDFAEHGVSAALTGLRSNSTYEFRLAATNSLGVVTGKVLTFATNGPPQVTEIRALNATQGSATLEGKINPSGFATSYRFEWGPTTSYGQQAPAEFEPYVGEGHQPVRVSAKLTGLSVGTTYHYRVAATSSAGTTTSPDHVLETLNSCGLPEGRCFELVSRGEAGPVAIPGETSSHIEMKYQAAPEGSGLAYPVESGYPDATKGAVVLYRGLRGPSAWSSTQLSVPLIAQNEQTDTPSGAGAVEWLSHDLSCGFAQAFQPLTSDAAMRLVREYGGSNLYRINPDGSYTAVTKLAPENPEVSASVSNYEIVGASQDCGKVLFLTRYRYPGIPGVGTSRLYEWNEGTLRNVGVVPGPSGEVVVEASPGYVAGGGFGSYQNIVSEGGSRVFFSAIRETSPNPAEIGAGGIFVRENGATTRDISLSETSTPDEGANYQWASPDGSRVFFTANAGLTADSSSEGTDLYMYDLETEKLTDLTAYHGAGGAQVRGFLAAAEDGSHVYFASRNRLVPGMGPTLAENQSNETLSIYGASNGKFSFVGTFREDTSEFRRVVLRYQGYWSSRVSADGRYLLFQSSTNITGYPGGNTRQAYLYDADGGSEGTTCISCRQDGQASVAPPEYEVLPVDTAIGNFFDPARLLVVHNGEPRVFFSSPDKLAPGAVERQNNIYEWVHGQVFRLVSALEGQQSPSPTGGIFALFAGASSDGSDTYLATPETLTWEDGDARVSIYDARVGGGHPEPPPPPASCLPTTESSCQGPSQGGAVVPGAASATFNGPGNPKQAEPQKKKKSKKKKSKKHAKKKGSGKKARHANGNRRAGK